MSGTRSTRKNVFIHLGPHKTGSTAIQKCLTANAAALRKEGIDFFHNDVTHKAALLLANESFELAEDTLSEVSRRISDCDATTVILSQEDFCGELPGRSRRRSIYPKLTRNLRIIKRSLFDHNLHFLFFLRDEHEWLHSCYTQHLRFRTQFSSYSSFLEAYGGDWTWGELLAKPKDLLGPSLLTMAYNREYSSGTRALLSVANGATVNLQIEPTNENASPSKLNIAALERINAVTSSKSTAWFAKALHLGEWHPIHPCISAGTRGVVYDSLASIAFPELLSRSLVRVSKHDVPDILPDQGCDLEPLLYRFLPKDVELPSTHRADIRAQSRILDYHLRGKSELAKLNGLVISYLRRDTPHTLKAKSLFHRIWFEHGRSLVNELSTRWLISSLQTFLDHGLNEGQRLIGSAGFFYSNLMKIYETERSLEGLAQDATYSVAAPQTESRFPGMDRFSLGGSDILLNTNALLLELSTRDEVAGLVLVEFLLRVSESGNVFTRMDRSRQALNVEVEGFEDTWSFYKKPR